MSTTDFGCAVMAGLILLAVIVLPMAALKVGYDRLETRMAELELRPWHSVLAREHRRAIR